MYDYSGFYNLLNKKNKKKSDLITELNISSRTIAKIGKGEKLGTRTLNKLCEYFNCTTEDLFKVISNNAILQRLRDEKNNKISGGLYHEIQIRMTYNSNHMEGSTLTEEQTRRIFETKTIDSTNTPIDDIIETVNHFRAIDYCIDVADTPLNEDIIKKIHFLLKKSTYDETLDWFNVGNYKLRPNTVGGKKTTSPKNVEKAVQNLLILYNSKKTITINDIISFHYEFESIHPFQDGNGRVGRLIAFKECLRHNITPFIIEEHKKYFYYRGLNESNYEQGFLIDTCLDGQDTFQKLVDYFEV